MVEWYVRFLILVLPECIRVEAVKFLQPLWPSRPEADEVERPFSNGIKCLTWSC